MERTKKIEMIKCRFNHETCGILIDDMEKVMISIDNAVKEIKSKGNNGITPCYLMYPGDCEGLGCPPDRNVSREDYEANPGKYGVAIYTNWNNNVTFE